MAKSYYMTHNSSYRAVQAFYDQYWPANLPDWKETRKHIHKLLPRKHFVRILDAGCGSGVCAFSLAEKAKDVVGIDLSFNSLRSAQTLGQKTGRRNIFWLQGDLLSLPLASASFDCILCWGVIHHTLDPAQALAELVRVLRPDGLLILAAYRRTAFTGLHEIIRTLCLKMPAAYRPRSISIVAAVVRFLERLGKNHNLRADNPHIQSQVEDWFFVPVKHFFTIAEMHHLFIRHGLSFEITCSQTGRFKSSSNFIVQGRKFLMQKC